eukprot:6198440-Pleurochrysis_carterae.AAC.2
MSSKHASTAWRGSARAQRLPAELHAPVYTESVGLLEQSRASRGCCVPAAHVGCGCRLGRGALCEEEKLACASVGESARARGVRGRAGSGGEVGVRGSSGAGRGEFGGEKGVASFVGGERGWFSAQYSCTRCCCCLARATSNGDAEARKA